MTNSLQLETSDFEAEGDALDALIEQRATGFPHRGCGKDRRRALPGPCRGCEIRQLARSVALAYVSQDRRPQEPASGAHALQAGEGTPEGAIGEMVASGGALPRGSASGSGLGSGGEA